MKFAFLIYVSRSGSTMLAKQLSMYSPDIVMLPEFNLLDILLNEGDEAVKEMGAPKILELMKLDRQLINLNFSADMLQEIANRNAGKNIKSIIEDVISHYASMQSRNPVFVILKKGSYLFRYKQLHSLFPEAIFLHIYRDGRAAINSMIHTYRPYYPNEKFLRGDIVYAARRWKNYLGKVHSLKKENLIPVVEIRYEDLCLSPEETVRPFISKIGIAYDESYESNAISTFDVGSQEKTIHSRIHDAPILKRIEAWKKELPIWQGTAIEMQIGHVLEANGYDIWFKKRTNKLIIPFYQIKAIVNHYYLSTVYYCRKIAFYRKNRHRVRNRILHTVAKYKYKYIRK